MTYYDLAKVNEDITRLINVKDLFPDWDNAVPLFVGWDSGVYVIVGWDHEDKRYLFGIRHPLDLPEEYQTHEPPPWVDKETERALTDKYGDYVYILWNGFGYTVFSINDETKEVFIVQGFPRF